jgi:hypothetical protein
VVLKRGEDFKESEVYGTEEALARISMELLHPMDDKLLTISDITPVEGFGLPVMMALAKKFNSEMSREWIRNFLLLRISRLRSGRTEFTIILSGMREFAELKKKGKISDIYSGLS